MAAYGALVSVMHIIDQLQLHPHPPISLDKEQTECLTEKVTFLQHFLESYSHVDSKEVDELESRIAAAAYVAEDVIESHIVDQILAGSCQFLLDLFDSCWFGSIDQSRAKRITSVDLYQGLQKVIEDMDFINKEALAIKEVIEDMDFINKEALAIKEKIGVKQDDQLHRTSSVSASTGQKKTEMVGFDDVLIEMLDKLTGGQPHRQIIPIVGMGGSGKTTLTRNICEHKVVIGHFDIVAWGTVSQEYRMTIILEEILGEKGGGQAELETKLYQKLWGRRYLIILDDIWDIEVWHLLNRFFPDNKNGSRIMVTTRQFNLAFQLSDSFGLVMKSLDLNESWDLFCKVVFGEEECPPHLKETADIIVENCKGLPLSIVVIGGLLVKSEKRQEYWKYIAENLNSIVNLEDNERCLQILYLSYNTLPVHVKLCFLYMGIFSKYVVVQPSYLIELWISEGFIKPHDGKSLEDVGEEHFAELVVRNLILVRVFSFRGRVKFCTVHDLLRDLCLREVKKYKFLCVNPKDISTQRRISAYKSTSEKEYSAEIFDALETASLARSLFWEFQEPSPSFNFRLLRISQTYYEDADQVSSLEPSFFQHVNLRYLKVHTTWEAFSGLVSSISLFWNLQTIFVGIPTFEDTLFLPLEIWKMPLLRNVDISVIVLPDPPTSTGDKSDGRDDVIVLENLQMLRSVMNFRCSEEVVKRIPNIKKLRIAYMEIEDEGSPPDDYGLDNLCHLYALETLDFCTITPSIHLVQNITFPHSLKKLILRGTQLEWEDMATKIGSLPLLEILKLRDDSCIGPHWETVEGQFCCLEFLVIEECQDLEEWTTDSTHFPRLERLILRDLDKLEEIPSCIGDIPTMKLIELRHCSDSANDSAQRILEEQQEYENVDLEVKVSRDQ